jgi:hypothetical protein
MYIIDSEQSFSLTNVLNTIIFQIFLQHFPSLFSQDTGEIYEAHQVS